MNNTESVFDYYKLKTWIEPKRIYWWKLLTCNNAFPFIEKHINILDQECLKKLSRNPFAVDMLERHIDKISWNDFVHNPNAIHVIDKHIDICFKSLDSYGKVNLLRHPNFIHILEKNIDKIIHQLLCSGPISILAKSSNHKYIDLLEKYMKAYPDKISSYFWNDLCENPLAVHIINQNLDKLNNHSWQLLAKNPNAIHIIEENLDKLGDSGWRYLCENPNAIPILEKNLHKVNWSYLSSNINGIQLLEKNIDKITCYSFFDYENFSINSSIFEIDYDAIRNRCHIYKEELMQVALHPSRIEQYLAQGISVEELDNYI